MISFLTTILVIIVALFLFNLLMGYKKDNITLDLEERYTNQKKQSYAVIKELMIQGKTAEYTGNGEYSVDGKRYAVMQRNVGMGGAALQPTVLVPIKA